MNLTQWTRLTLAVLLLGGACACTGSLTLTQSGDIRLDCSITFPRDPRCPQR